MTPTWNCVLSPSHPVSPPSGDMNGWTDFRKKTQSERERPHRSESFCEADPPIQTDWRINKSPTHDFDIFFPPRAPRARDLLCAHQQSNSICNELRCSQKVEGCKSERKVAFFDIWVRSEVARLMVLTGKRCCYDEHKQNKPSLPGRKKKKDQVKRATTSEPHFCTLCRWQLCRRLTSTVENHWKM